MALSNGIRTLGLLLPAAFLPLALGQDQEGQAEGEEERHWRITGAVGLSLAQGNSDAAQANMSLLGVKEWELNQLEAGVKGSYAVSDGERSNQNARGSLQYNRLKSGRRSYLFGKLDLLYDAIADVDYRLSLGAGYGYSPIDRERLSLSLDAGPGFVAERAGGVRDHYMSLSLGQRLDWEISSSSRLWQSLECLPELSDPANFILALEVGAESDLTSRLGLRATLEDRFDNRPAPGRRANDIQLVAGLSYRF